MLDETASFTPAAVEALQTNILRLYVLGLQIQSLDLLDFGAGSRMRIVRHSGVKFQIFFVVSLTLLQFQLLLSLLYPLRVPKQVPPHHTYFPSHEGITLRVLGRGSLTLCMAVLVVP